MTRFLSLVLFLALASTSAAQDTPPAEDLLPPVNIDFRVFPLGEANWDGIYYFAEEGEPVEVRFNSFNRSLRSYSYEGPPWLVFYRKGPVVEGEQTWNPVAAVEIKGRYDEPLIFFTRSSVIDPNDPPPANAGVTGPARPEFNLAIYDDSPRAFPSDHVVFLNVTGAPLLGIFGDRKMFFNRGLEGPMDLDSLGMEDIKVGLVVKREDDVKVVMNNRWSFQPGNRHIIILMPPRSANSYKIRAYRITEFVGENERYFPGSATTESTPGDQ